MCLSAPLCLYKAFNTDCRNVYHCYFDKMLTYDTPTQYYVILHQCLRSQHRVLHPALHSSEAECNMKCMLLSIYSHHYYAGIPYGWGWIKHSFLSSFLKSFCLFLNNQSLWSDTILYPATSSQTIMHSSRGLSRTWSQCASRALFCMPCRCCFCCFCCFCRWHFVFFHVCPRNMIRGTLFVHKESLINQ